MQNDKDLSTWQTFRRLWPIIAPFKAGLIVAAVALVLNAGSDTFMLSLLKPLLDDGFGKTDRSVLLWMPLVVIGLMVLRGITSYISSYCISWVSGKVVMTMRRRLFGHMMGMPVAFFDKQSTGTLLSRITYDSEQVASSSSSALITVVREGASIIGLFVMMFYYSWQLSLILIVLAPIVSVAIRVVSKRFRNISKNMQNTMGQVTTSAEQMLKGHKEVLMFGGQEVETKRFDKVSNKMRLQDEDGFRLVYLRPDHSAYRLPGAGLCPVRRQLPERDGYPDRRDHYRGLLLHDCADASAEVADQRQCPVPARDGGMPDAVCDPRFRAGKRRRYARH